MMRPGRVHCVTPPIVGVSCHACASVLCDIAQLDHNQIYFEKYGLIVTAVTMRDIRRLLQQCVTRGFCHTHAATRVIPVLRAV